MVPDRTGRGVRVDFELIYRSRGRVLGNDAAVAQIRDLAGSQSGRFQQLIGVLPEARWRQAQWQ
jgi:hypothetical protein